MYMPVNGSGGKIIPRLRRHPLNRSDASAYGHSQWTNASFTLVTLPSRLQDGRLERRRSEYTDAFLVDFLCGVFTWSRFIDKMSPKKVYSFCCLLFSLTGVITIIRSVQWHFLVTWIPSVSQMLLATALQRLLLREWVKMSCFLSLLFLHSSILSQEEQPPLCRDHLLLFFLGLNWRR